MEPVEPSMATPVLCMRLLRDQEGDDDFRIVGVKKIDLLAVFLYVRSCAHAPLVSSHIDEVNRSINGLVCADDFQIQRCLTVAVNHVHASRNNAAKVLYFTNVLSQLFTCAQEVFSFRRRFAVSNLVERQTDDAADKQRHHE